jgi:hypothetical protein
MLMPRTRPLRLWRLTRLTRLDQQTIPHHLHRHMSSEMPVITSGPKLCKIIDHSSRQATNTTGSSHNFALQTIEALIWQRAPDRSHQGTKISKPRSHRCTKHARQCSTRVAVARPLISKFRARRIDSVFVRDIPLYERLYSWIESMLRHNSQSSTAFALSTLALFYQRNVTACSPTRCSTLYKPNVSLLSSVRTRMLSSQRPQAVGRLRSLRWLSAN